MDVIDLHCDLLAYLAISPDRTPLDPNPRCSLKQLQSGGVQTQILAISSETNMYSLGFGLRQLEIFSSLQDSYPEYLKMTNLIPAFENASSFCLEQEPLDLIFKRLEKIFSQIKPLYIGMTWNGKNRFGGGCGTSLGLTDEGKELLSFLSGRKIAIDFSHATDTRARQTLEYIDAKGLDLDVMASHSNFRAIVNHERNLPDDIAKEIISRGGIIGLVFYSKFIQSPQTLYPMIEHGLKLGAEPALAFGSDFFCTEDFSSVSSSPHTFFDEMANATCYPNVLHQIQKQMHLSDEQLQSIASKNAQNFIASMK